MQKTYLPPCVRIGKAPGFPGALFIWPLGSAVAAAVPVVAAAMAAAAALVVFAAAAAGAQHTAASAAVVATEAAGGHFQAATGAIATEGNLFNRTPMGELGIFGLIVTATTKCH